MKKQALSSLLARCGIAFCFLVLGIWEIVQPSYWSGYVPDFATHIMDVNTLVRLHGTALSIVGLGVLSGVYLPIFSGLAVLIMLEICGSLIFGTGFDDIFVRDIAILFLAASVFVGSLPDRTSEK